MISEQASFLNPVDMMIVMVVALIVFGPKKLPEVGRQLGQAMREIKKLTGELTDTFQNEAEGIKSTFDSVSPYKLISEPIDTERKLPNPDKGYSNEESMKESPLLSAKVEVSTEPEAETEVSSAIAEAAAVQLTPVTPKSGESV